MKTTNQPPTMPPSGSSAIPETTAAAQKEILVAIDFSPSSVTALRHAALLAARENAHLTLLNIVNESASFRALDVARRERRQHVEHTLRLQEFARRELGSDNHAQLMVRSGDPAAEITRVAAEQHAQLLVVGCHEHHGPSHWFHRHTANRVIRQAPCPVIVLNEDTPEPEPGGLAA